MPTRKRLLDFFSAPFVTLREIIFITCASLLITIVLPGCANKVDAIKAQALTENLLIDLKNENYNSLNAHYTSSFNESEPLDRKIEKFKRLKKNTGSIKSFELINSKENQDADRGIGELILKYKVVCEHVVVEEAFLVINDEGDEKIIFQNIENMK